MKKVGFLLIMALLLGACGQKRNLVYFSDLRDSIAYESRIIEASNIKIKSGDILSISVSTLNPESNILFNTGTLQSIEANRESSGNLATSQGYLVDSKGQINFPVVGKIAIAGKTKEEATDFLVSTLKPYVKDPIINLRFLNFRVTVVGEVNKPSTFTVTGDQINLIEALGLAGDMTMYGKRENVLLIREEEGKRTMVRLDLNKKETMDSKYFFLKQNDIVYVEPDKMKEKQSRTDIRTITLISSLASLAIVAISRL
ncbi:MULTISPECIES: polysaccharide biosynthesis/export family protein [Olivibacter]|jgi:polysaccharide export outer membrane protein|uniref:Polysaccharide biosynthesis/export family protein n=1 Tax=Olivibacter oleidegradans TaxID=760123 RepID=A0ABV6HG70_9SPHI|nr:polysaccharide biosynthesis/export family protein [Olivibacter jilunii]